MLRWVIAYFAASWFAYQVLSLIVHNLELPTVILKISTVLLVIGGLIAAVLAYYQGARALPKISGFEALLLTSILMVGALLIWIIAGGRQTIRLSDAGLINVTRRPLGLGEQTAAYLLVYPQNEWQYTGVTVSAGQTVTLFAEGRVHLALERLVEAAQSDRLSKYEWLTPTGEPSATVDLGRAGRERCLLNPRFPRGSLLVAVAPAEHLTPAESRAMVPNVTLFAVPGTTTITIATPGNLHFAVNDVYIDERACDPELYDKHVDPRVFFGDNLGFFSVQLQVK